MGLPPPPRRPCVRQGPRGQHRDRSKAAATSSSSVWPDGLTSHAHRLPAIQRELVTLGIVGALGAGTSRSQGSRPRVVNQGPEPPRRHCVRPNPCRAPAAPAPWAARPCPAREPQGVRVSGTCLPRAVSPLLCGPRSGHRLPGRGLKARAWVCGRRERTANPVAECLPHGRGGPGLRAAQGARPALPRPTEEAQPAVTAVPKSSPGAVIASAVTAHGWAACRKAHLMFAVHQLSFGFNILFSVS